MTHNNNNTPVVLWGIAAIAATINRTPSETRWLIRKGALRVRRHGHRTYSAIKHELIEDCAGERFPAA